MLLDDSRLGQGCISLHNNNYFLYIQEKVSMECRNDFDFRKPANLSVYFRQLPNIVNVCFLDYSICTVLKKFNLALLKVVKCMECFLPSPTFDLWSGTKVLIAHPTDFFIKEQPQCLAGYMWVPNWDVWISLGGVWKKWTKRKLVPWQSIFLSLHFVMKPEGKTNLGYT